MMNGCSDSFSARNSMKNLIIRERNGKEGGKCRPSVFVVMGSRKVV